LDTLEIDTHNPRQVKQFLDLPFRLNRDVPQWVPPLAMDARRMQRELRDLGVNFYKTHRMYCKAL